MNVDQVYDSDKWLRAQHLQGRDYNLTILGARLETFKDGKKQIALKLKETQREFGLNKTNARIVKKLYGPETNAWVGERICVYPTETEFQGEIVPCIRVRAPMQQEVQQVAATPAAPPPGREELGEGGTQMAQPASTDPFGDVPEPGGLVLDEDDEPINF